MKKIFLLFLVTIFSLSFFILNGNNTQAWTPGVNEGWFSCFNGLPQAGMEWADVDGADGYQVWRGATKVYEGRFTNFTDTTVDYNTNYRYEIQVLFPPEVIWNHVDGGDINTGSCVYVSNLVGPSSFEVTTDSKTYSADYVWGDSAAGVRSLEIYKDGIQLASGSANDLVPPSGADTKTASFVGFSIAGSYQFCARGTIEPSGKEDLKCMDIDVTPPPASLNLSVKKTGEPDTSYGDSVIINLNEAVDLQWSSISTELGTCKKSADKTGSGWPSISPFPPVENSGEEIGVGFTSADTYILKVSCDSALGFRYEIINIASAAENIEDDVVIEVLEGGGDGRDADANLIVDTMFSSPVPGQLNETIAFAADIKNIGNLLSSSSIARIRIDKDNNGSWDFSSTRTTVALDPELATTVTFTWSTNSANTHKYEVCADSTDVVGESNETDNCEVGFFSVAAGSPDLIISGAISVSPSTPTIGQNVSFSAVAKNSGTANAGSSKTRLQIDVGDTGTWDFTSDKNTGALPPNETETENWNNVWTAVEGTHRVRVCADGLNDVIESNENNNCAEDVILTVGDALAVDLEVKESGSTWLQSLTGEAPFNNVDLRATVSGAAAGRINYTFYCNRSDDGINVTPDFDSQFLNENSTQKNDENLCDYATQGIYTAKVIIEREGLFAEDRATITVTAPSNSPPTTTSRSVTLGAACVNPLQPTLNWTFSDPDGGDSQTAYHIQVDDSGSFNSPEADSGKIISSSNAYTIPTGSLSFDKRYNWRVRVWDQADETGGYAVGPDFNTQVHAAPDTDFSWNPTEPSVDETVNFTDATAFFGGATGQNWSWTFQDGTPSLSSARNPSSRFSPSGTKTISLIVIDSDGLTCSIDKNIEIALPVPDFREVIP